MLSTACLLSEKPFSPKKDGVVFAVCIKKRLTARHLSQLFQATFQCIFLLEGPFIKIIFVIAFWDAFLCVPLAIQYGMNLKGKYVGWYYKTLFVQLSFWLQFFFWERIMVQSSCCAMQTHTMETSFEIKQITAEALLSIVMHAEHWRLWTL